MSKQPKKLPKPAPCERWGIYDESGRFVHQYTSRWAASEQAWGERTMHRVRIVPVAKAKRRKGGGK